MFKHIKIVILGSIKSRVPKHSIKACQKSVSV